MLPDNLLHVKFNFKLLPWITMDYPRVTEILRPFNCYDHVPKDVLENAAARGTTVHGYCAAIAKGAWVPDSMMQEDYRGYVDSFRKWADAQVEEFTIVEKRYTDEIVEFSGQVDFVILGKDKKAYLADLKTCAKPQKTHAIQMAAYNYLLFEHGIEVEGAMLVYLSKTGEFPDIEMLENMNRETKIFFSALECYNYFKRKKSNGKKKDA